MKTYKAIGLMSGTSMDGIDLALIESNGKEIIARKNFFYSPYEKEFKERITKIIYEQTTVREIKLIENELTILHADFVNDFIAKNNINKSEIDLIAFHGHTILHVPKQYITWQIGNAPMLARLTNIDVISDFRTRDVTLKGQGAPLVPIYHFHLFAKQNKPTAILNIGGISNITYFSSDDESSIQAYDTGFGNAPFDDLMQKKFNLDFDRNGDLARRGQVDFILANHILENEIFSKKPPKSFDRNDFTTLLMPIANLRAEDALATFAYMHAKAIVLNLKFLHTSPKEIFVCGGGRKNIAIMDELKKQLSDIKIKTVEEIGFNGDAIEAEAFAFLGIRSLLNLPISFENTTGIKASKGKACGGVMFKV